MSTIKQLEEQIKSLKERQLPFGWTVESIKNLQEERDEYKEENTEQYCEIIKLKEQLKSAEDLNVIYYRHMVKMGCEKGCCSLDIDGNPMLK
tara:strand:- start:64 stop:339 length:276 start_codon:yes stop_codon:yes gene_type:complete